MSEWLVDEDSCSVSDYLAIDEYLAYNSEERVLRPDTLDQEAYLLAWRTSYDDLEGIDEGAEVNRRLTDGSTIYCPESAFTYSIFVPTNEFPSNVFDNVIAPGLMEVLDPYLEDMSIDLRHDAIRTGDQPTPGGIPEGFQISGNGFRRTRKGVLCQGIIPTEPWDLTGLEMRDGEKEFIESMPYIDEEPEVLKDRFLKAFTSDSYRELELNTETLESIEEIKDSRYQNSSWIEEPDIETVEREGFCMVCSSEDMLY